MGNIIEQIHHDINTSYLERFQTCSETIDRESVELDKYDIAKLGFKSYESEIQKSEKLIASKQYIETVNRLKIDYPYKKFITYDQVGKILEKYPLVLDTPERFIGKIPDNCIKDILNFKLKDSDKGYNPIPNIKTILKQNIKELYHIEAIIKEIVSIVRSRMLMSFGTYKEESKEEKILKIKANYGELVNEIIYAMDISVSAYRCKDSFVVRNYYFKLKTEDGYTSIEHKYSLKNSDYNIYTFPNIQSTSVPEYGPQFWILATSDQFDIKASEIVVGGCIKEVGQGSSYITLKDDPIILKPIKEGLIVVTQWGAEAQLPEFINSINN